MIGTPVTPDDRHGERILPAWDEQWIVDLYAEGYSHRYIERETGVAISTQKHLIARRGIPLAWEPSATDCPPILTDAELMAGERAANARMDAIADARLALAADELAAWEMRQALIGVAA